MYIFPPTFTSFEYPGVRQDFETIDNFKKYLPLYCAVNQLPGFKSGYSNGNVSTYKCNNAPNCSGKIVCKKTHVKGTDGGIIDSECLITESKACICDKVGYKLPINTHSSALKLIVFNSRDDLTFAISQYSSRLSVFPYEYVYNSNGKLLTFICRNPHHCECPGVIKVHHTKNLTSNYQVFEVVNCFNKDIGGNCCVLCSTEEIKSYIQCPVCNGGFLCPECLPGFIGHRRQDKNHYWSPNMLFRTEIQYYVIEFQPMQCPICNIGMYVDVSFHSEAGVVTKIVFPAGFIGETPIFDQLIFDLVYQLHLSQLTTEQEVGTTAVMVKNYLASFSSELEECTFSLLSAAFQLYNKKVSYPNRFPVGNIVSNVMERIKTLHSTSTGIRIKKLAKICEQLMYEILLVISLIDQDDRYSKQQGKHVFICVLCIWREINNKDPNNRLWSVVDKQLQELQDCCWWKHYKIKQSDISEREALMKGKNDYGTWLAGDPTPYSIDDIAF
jgi:hypothetical protein